MRGHKRCGDRSSDGEVTGIENHCKGSGAFFSFFFSLQTEGFVAAEMREKKGLGSFNSYDCAIYVMKWLEIIQPENVKREKCEWDNWTQEEVDHFRVEFASRILYHEMNQDRAEAIKGSDAVRLSKPSSLLLSPYCLIDSYDIDSD
ncbi:uncharacterized protein DS421_15g515680 [Arachis hypogaea]|nr:uncharacterized protein DS421_15g515680 [Arachis hypogaea]